MVQRARVAAAVTAVALLGTGLTGCSLFGLEDDPPLECPGEEPPAAEPGEARVLLTIAEGAGPWDLTTVVYDDGTAAVLDGQQEALSTNALPAAGAVPRAVAGPYADQPGSWHGGYLLPCALDEVRTLATDALFGSPEYGRVAVTDRPWTYVSYDNGATRAEVEVYAFDTGYTEGLDWSERRARESLAKLTHFLQANLVSTGEELPVTAVQVDGSHEVGEDFEWPGPPPAELLGEDGCGVLAEDQATAVLERAREDGLGEAGSQLTVRALPPGIAGCG
ncbi:MAG TPA: hypothetical protein VK060_08440 [Ruania sp.]|nr:hypothetical protein [Ruania sp.]